MSKEIGKPSAKEIAVDYANSVWNGKDTQVIDRLVHKDVVIHSPLGDFHGTKALKEVVEAWLTGFPDLQVANDQIISQDDLVSTQWHVKATHKGEFRGRRATGKPVSYSGATIYRVKDGKIVEYWVYIDMDHLLSQLK